MAKVKEENPAVQETQTEPAAQPSARERYRNRYGERYPDMNLDDEEAFYTQANANLDELENFRESDRLLGEAFDKTPLLAGLVLAAKEGENPFTYLAENIGPDMDIRALANDEEFGKKMGEALAKYQENLAKGAQATKELGENFKQTMAALDEVAKEKGLDDEAKAELFKKMFGYADEEGNAVDNGIFGNASVGIVPKEVWEAVLKAQNYDNDIASATEKARATALNEKVQNGIKNFGSGVPNLSGGGKGAGERKPVNKVGFAAFGEDLK